MSERGASAAQIDDDDAAVAGVGIVRIALGSGARRGKRQLEERLRREPKLLVLDVRQPGEWSAGHIEAAMHITGAELPGRIDEVPKDRPVATLCGSGYRSSVSASLLVKHGHPDVANVLGGMSAWKAAGFPGAKNNQ